jgi:hypothetical protein
VLLKIPCSFKNGLVAKLIKNGLATELIKRKNTQMVRNTIHSYICALKNSLAIELREKTNKWLLCENLNFGIDKWLLCANIGIFE